MTFKKIIIPIAGCLLMLALAAGGWYFWKGTRSYSLKGLSAIAYKYDQICPFHNGLALVSENHKWGVIDSVGNEVVPCKYEILLGLSEGMAAFKKDGLFGYIDKSGEEVIAYQYDWADPFSEGLAAVRKGERYGYINTKGDIVIPFKFSSAEPFREGLAAVIYPNGKSGFINNKGEMELSYNFNRSLGFSNGLAAVQSNDEEGYYFIDKKGKRLTEMNWMDYRGTMEEFTGKYASLITLVGGCVVIDNKGNEIIPFSFRECLPICCEDVFIIKEDEGYIIKDSSNKTVCSLNYDDVGTFSDGLIEVGKKGKYGYMNKNGEEVIPLVYDACGPFSEGLAAVVKDGLYGIIDKKGESTFDYMSDETKELAEIKKKKGRVNIMSPRM